MCSMMCAVVNFLIRRDEAVAAEPEKPMMRRWLAISS